MKKCCPKKKRRPNATAVQNLRNWYQWATQYSHKHATVGIPQGILLIGLCQPTSITTVEFWSNSKSQELPHWNTVISIYEMMESSTRMGFPPENVVLPKEWSKR
jgi:hypothetical protein